MDKLTVEEALRMAALYASEGEHGYEDIYLQLAKTMRENNSLRSTLEKCREFQVDNELDRIIDPVLRAYDHQYKQSENFSREIGKETPMQNAMLQYQTKT